MSGRAERRSDRDDWVVGDDDAPAKAMVVELFEVAGFFPIDLGDSVARGRMQRGAVAIAYLVRLPPGW